MQEAHQVLALLHDTFVLESEIAYPNFQYHPTFKARIEGAMTHGDGSRITLKDLIDSGLSPIAVAQLYSQAARSAVRTKQAQPHPSAQAASAHIPRSAIAASESPSALTPDSAQATREGAAVTAHAPNGTAIHGDQVPPEIAPAGVRIPLVILVPRHQAAAPHSRASASDAADRSDPVLLEVHVSCVGLLKKGER